MGPLRKSVSVRLEEGVQVYKPSRNLEAVLATRYVQTPATLGNY